MLGIDPRRLDGVDGSRLARTFTEVFRSRRISVLGVTKGARSTGLSVSTARRTQRRDRVVP